MTYFITFENMIAVEADTENDAKEEAIEKFVEILQRGEAHLEAEKEE